MANGFRVEPQAVRDFAQHIRNCKEDTADAVGYLNRNGDLSWTQTGFLNLLRGAHEMVLAELGRRFTHLKDVLEQSANELENTATYYEETDTATAAQFDQFLPPSDRVRSGDEP